MGAACWPFSPHGRTQPKVDRNPALPGSPTTASGECHSQGRCTGRTRRRRRLPCGLPEPRTRAHPASSVSGCELIHRGAAGERRAAASRVAYTSGAKPSDGAGKGGGPRGHQSLHLRWGQPAQQARMLWTGWGWGSSRSGGLQALGMGPPSNLLGQTSCEPWGYGAGNPWSGRVSPGENLATCPWGGCCTWGSGWSRHWPAGLWAGVAAKSAWHAGSPGCGSGPASILATVPTLCAHPAVSGQNSRGWW